MNQSPAFIAMDDVGGNSATTDALITYRKLPYSVKSMERLPADGVIVKYPFCVLAFPYM